MPIVSIVMGALLVGLGVYGYTAADPDLGQKQSWTALIPAFVGGPLILCGLIALKESLLKHAMHAAAMLGVLGFLAAAGRLGTVAAKGSLDVSKLGEQSLLAMTGICAIFVVLCVRSFIAARRRRLARPAGL
jgi:hypothetical protein